MSASEIVSTVLLACGGLILVASAAGVLRFPDFYSRLHAAGKGDTLGQGLILLGLAIPAGLGLVTLKIALIALFIFVFSPTATHALARGAWITGLKPWTLADAPPSDGHGEPDEEGA